MYAPNTLAGGWQEEAGEKWLMEEEWMSSVQDMRVEKKEWL